MATVKKKKTQRKSAQDYRHEEAKRMNNPPAGLAWQDTEKPSKRIFNYDPHADPHLEWAGKAEHVSFEVEAPSIHVHERLSTAAILSAVRKEQPQLGLFEDQDLDRTKAIEFYQHRMNWANRLILGDSLVAMTSLLEKERLAGQVQTIYIDPPYGINYNSNFQAKISNRNPKETADETVTREPEQIQAFRDTWQLGIHSYLTYLRDRLLVARELLAESGSVFVQIGPDNLHLVRSLLDEIFGAENTCAVITVGKTSQVTSKLLPEVSDFLLWYGKDKSRLKYFQLFEERGLPIGDDTYRFVESSDGTRREMTPDERKNPGGVIEHGGKIYSHSDPTSQGFSAHKTVPFEFEGRVFKPPANRHWLLRPEGMAGLARAGRLEVSGSNIWYVRYWDDFSGARLTNIWTDTSSSFAARRYVVQTVPKIVERCILMTTEPGDLVVDPTCGSATTAWVCEKWGRRWVTIDTSRVAVAIARERLLTSKFPYFSVKDPSLGVDAGLNYRALKRVTASSVGYANQPEEETLYDQPLVDGQKVRISGPFTVEAPSRYALNPLASGTAPQAESQDAGDHVRQLLAALKTHGIPRRGSKPLPITSLEPLASIGPLQAEGVLGVAWGTKPFAVSIGPRFGAITPRQVDEALSEAHGYGLVVFVGFAAHAETQEMLSKGRRGRYEVALLMANPDLLVGDLLKITTASQTFRLFASPDVRIKSRKDGEISVELLGVDSYDALTGQVTSVRREDVAAWFLDQDHDVMVFHVSQAFFPKGNSWELLERALKGVVDAGLMERLQSFESLPFKAGPNRNVAIRVITDDGNASESILALET